MATFHLSVKTISRAEGRSATAAAAYRHGERFQDERTGEVFDYRAKGDVDQSFILLPENAPEWMNDREQLWNAAELAEKRKDAQISREVELALPRELSQKAQENLVRDYAQRHFADQGMVADIAIHRPKASDGKSQPHAHIMLTTRKIDTSKQHGFGLKERDWNSKSRLLEWRQDWAKSMNQAYEKHKLPFRVSEKSYKAQGIKKQPQVHMGPKAWNARRRKIATDRARRVAAISNRNALLKARQASRRFMKGNFPSGQLGQAVQAAKGINPTKIASYQAMAMKAQKFATRAAGAQKPIEQARAQERSRSP